MYSYVFGALLIGILLGAGTSYATLSFDDYKTMTLNEKSGSCKIVEQFSIKTLIFSKTFRIEKIFPLYDCGQITLTYKGNVTHIPEIEEVRV